MNRNLRDITLHPGESSRCDAALITAPDLVSGAWQRLGAISSPALHSVIACPDLLFIQPARHGGITETSSELYNIMWFIPSGTKKKKNAKDSRSLAQCTSMTEIHPGSQTRYDVPALALRAATKR